MVHRCRADSTTQTYPDLQPLYDAARSYLEIPQRINLLNTRVEVRTITGQRARHIDSGCFLSGLARHAPITEGNRFK